MDWATQFLGNTFLLAVVLLIVRQFEKRNPIEANQDASEVIVDWKLAGVKWAASQLFTPVINVCAVALSTAVGGGFIPLPSEGWGLIFSFVVLIVAVDFWVYIMHRAMHQIPVLWSMHSLHHSAEALSMVTGARHFWFEQITIGVFPIVGIIFKVPPELIMPIGFVSFLLGDGLVHLNMRVSFGRFALVLNNPQYHRIHHSVEPQHQNKNFCKMLPIFDVLFGSAWTPQRDEFPKTGLIPRETATGFIDGLIWPIRHKIPVLRSKIMNRLAIRELCWKESPIPCAGHDATAVAGEFVGEILAIAGANYVGCGIVPQTPRGECDRGAM